MLHKNTKKRALAVVSILLLQMSYLAPFQMAKAAILFQNDSEFQMDSDNLVIDYDGDNSGAGQSIYTQFGSTASGNAGRITWDIDSQTFVIDENFTVSTGSVNFSAASQTRLRETASFVNGTTVCNNVGEVIVDTTNSLLYICMDAGTNTWAAASSNADTLDGLDSTQFLRSDASDSYTSGTLTFASGTVLDLSAATALAPQGAAFPTCNGANTGSIFFNTTSGTLGVCDGTSFQTVGPQNFEDIYNADGDNTLTTSNGDFNIAAGTGNLNFDGAGLSFDGTTDSNFTVTGNSASDTTLTLSATNAGTGDGNVAISADGQISISSSTWNVSGAGVASGLTGITSTGNIDFSGSSQTRIRETATVTNGVTACTNAGELIVETTTNTLFICTDAGTDTWTKASAVGNADVLRFDPEYKDGIVVEDGSNNKGKLITAYDASSGVNEQYYNWTSRQGSLQDIDVQFKFPLPADFASTGDLTFSYQTGTTNATDNKADIYVYNATNLTTGAPTLCGSSTGNVSTTWTTATIAAATLDAGCTGATALDPEDVIEVRVRLYDSNGASTFANAGYVQLDYSR